MTAENRRTLIAVVRKAVLAGLVLLLAWLVLLGLRGAIPATTINLMNSEMSMERQPTGQALPLSLNPWSWDWSRSLWTGKPVAQTIGPSIGPTLGFIGVTVLYSLVLALVILFIGVFISRGTNRPAGLAKTRSVLRLLIISAGVSAPFFLWRTITLVYPSLWWGVSGTGPIVYWIDAVLLAAPLLIWLLVQSGHGEIAKWSEDNRPFDAALWRHLAIRLVIRILRLVGGIIVLGIFVEQISPMSTLGRQFVDVINRRDFPIIFGIAWALVVMVVVARLVADLIEIAYNRFGHPSLREATAERVPARRFAVPKAWLYVSLGLVAISMIVAVAAPLIAPYGYNEMSLAGRLLPPSAQHILGTDNLGRDVFSRIVFGVRDDVFIGLVAAGIAFLVATGWVWLAARVRSGGTWQGDTFEDLVMLPKDLLCAFPWLVLLLLLVILTMPTSGSGTSFVIALALVVSLAVLPRAVGMMQEAYRAPPEGGSWLPAVLRAVPVMVLFIVAGGILYAASAGYLGLGLPPPTPELGGMLSGPGRQYMLQAPWMALWPSATLVLLLFVWVMAGDALLERLGFKSKAVWSKVWE